MENSIIQFVLQSECCFYDTKLLPIRNVFSSTFVIFNLKQSWLWNYKFFPVYICTIFVGLGGNNIDTAHLQKNRLYFLRCHYSMAWGFGWTYFFILFLGLFFLAGLTNKRLHGGTRLNCILNWIAIVWHKIRNLWRTVLRTPLLARYRKA